MTIFWIILFGMVFMFGFVVAFGAPYVPTLKRQQKGAFEMLKLKKGQVFYDLGCGDGRLLKAAAESGLKAVGYEINPLLAALAWLRTRRYGGRVKVVWGNFWKADISGADAVFVFLIEHHMAKLDRFLRAQFKDRKVKVVSFGFSIPKKKPTAHRGALYLYSYGHLARGA
jgi:SAM-dependent methyltransferase